jgi:3D (Asp-Asp-Asp) domain-containing protein
LTLFSKYANIGTSPETGVFIMNLMKISFLKEKRSVILLIAIFIVASITSYPIIKGIQARYAPAPSYDLSQAKELAVIDGNSVISISDHSSSNPVNLNSPAAVYKSLSYQISSNSCSTRENMVITAYSSTPEQTDSTPFITASGCYVEDGIIANNMLPFGTKIRIPELYGNKVFEVQDRLNSRKGGDHIDIWFPSYQEAKEFGAKKTYIEILN